MEGLFFTMLALHLLAIISTMLWMVVEIKYRKSIIANVILSIIVFIGLVVLGLLIFSVWVFY